MIYFVEALLWILVAALALATALRGRILFNEGIREGAMDFLRLLPKVMIGVIGSFHPGVIMAVGTLSAKPENRAFGMGLFYTMYYAGGAVVPALCGWAADLVGGPEGALLAGAVVSALAVPLYLLHRRLAAHELMLARA